MMLPRRHTPISALLLLAMLLWTPGLSVAAEWYGGLAIGRATAQLSTPMGLTAPTARLGLEVAATAEFSRHFGAEFNYIELGARSTAFQLPPTIASQRGWAMAGLTKIPAGSVNLLLKTGLAHLDSEARYLLPYVRCTPENPTCAQRHSQDHAVHLLWGLGSEWTPGRWKVRLLYEQFTVAGAHPELLTLGVFWRVR